MDDTDELDGGSVAVAHGNYLGRGGGEYVAEALARTFDAPLYYGFGDPENIPGDIDATSLANDSLLSRFRGSKLVRDPLYFWKFRHLPELHEYRVVIQSGNEFGWYVPPEEQVVVRYLHSTPRTPYDQFPNKGGRLKESLYSEVARQLYQVTVPYPDVYVPNSERVARRASRYWGRTENVRVVYPPVDVDEFYHEPGEDYYFTVSRLFPEKRIAEMVRAFQDHPDKRLIIAGTGSDSHERDLKRMAGENVEFCGFVSEDEKRALFANAKATLFCAKNEDFGIVPIEAFASGCPVIGVRDGFTQSQIRDGVTGILYDRGAANLADAIARFEREGVDYAPEGLQTVASHYSTDRFQREMREVVRGAVDIAEVNARAHRYTADADDRVDDRADAFAPAEWDGLETGTRGD